MVQEQESQPGGVETEVMIDAMLDLSLAYDQAKEELGGC